jgi:hypothetical protein
MMSVEISNTEIVDVLSGYDLTSEERAEFDFIDWSKVESGSSSPEFFRYRDELYYLESEGRPQFAPEWQMYLTQTFFSGIVFRYTEDEDEEKLEVGMYYAS